VSGKDYLSEEQWRVAARLAREKGVVCHACGSSDLEVYGEEVHWRFGTPGQDLEVPLVCIGTDHWPPESLLLSKEEARRHLGLRPRTG
jgi:hypothetical protein